MNIGFSTGSIALGDFDKALRMMADKDSEVIELSSLREDELFPLMSSIAELNLSKYKYVSVHAPSKLFKYTEEQIIHALKPAIERSWPIIVHPDIITKEYLWKPLGRLLCIENMDKRKSAGRTADDLEKLFTVFPEATFCFDIAHAQQVDPTMQEAIEIVYRFRTKITQIHLSHVNSSSKHEKLNLEAIFTFKLISHLLPKNVPIILESVISEDYIDIELRNAQFVFSDELFEDYLLNNKNNSYKK